MTNEETKVVLKTLADNPLLSAEHITKALYKAIELVESQPCEDCISRKSLKQKLQENHDFIVNAYGNFRGMSLNDKIRVDEIINCIALIVNEPSVTPQPKTGEWIYTGDYFTEGMCRCSKCGVEVDPSEARKFCFECGSYNGGGEE